MAKAAREKHVALAAVAHPDDIEFTMAGTLLRLKQAGCEIHMWNLANGSCGTVTYEKNDIIRMRWEEAKAAAELAGAKIYPPIADDLAIFYDQSLLAHVAATIRQIKPTIVLTHSPQDYMEDHQNTCRLIVTGTFARGMKNFSTAPHVAPCGGDVAVYHAMPHGLCDQLRKRIYAGHYVDITPVLDKKRNMLAQHKSQKEWLDVSQGMDSYLKDMEFMSKRVGRMSGRFEYAEGWRRHLHFGFGPEDYDPLADLLGDDCYVDPKYEKSLG